MAVAAATVLALSPAVVAAPGDPITVPDGALRSCITTALGVAPDATVTEGDAAGITVLNCSSSGIADLTGMQHFTGMTEFVIHQNNVSDLTPLASLTSLETLNFGANGVPDLYPLAGLVNLRVLYAFYNNDPDVAPLAALPSLEFLDFRGNGLTDLDEIASMSSLTGLDLGDNPIGDVTALSSLSRLTTLLLTQTEIEDVTPLSGLTRLKTLFLGSNAIADISALGTLTGLASLYLGEQAVDLGVLDIDVEAPNPVLDSLGNPVPLADPRYDAVGNVFTPTGLPGPADPLPWSTPVTIGAATSNFSGELSFEQQPAMPISIPDPALLACVNTALGQGPADTVTAGQAASLTALTCTVQGVRDLTGLEHFTSATQMHLGGNHYTDLTPLTGLTNLSDLALGWNENPLDSLAPLAGLTGLTRLDLSMAGISAVDDLAGLTSLRELLIGGNQISDVTPLSSLTALTDLVLAGNRIGDISPLASLVALERADLAVQEIELGELVIGAPEPNPVTDMVDAPVVLTDSRYDIAANAIVPVGSPGSAEPVEWRISVTIGLATDVEYSGWLMFTQVAGSSEGVDSESADRDAADSTPTATGVDMLPSTGADATVLRWLLLGSIALVAAGALLWLVRRARSRQQPGTTR